MQDFFAYSKNEIRNLTIKDSYVESSGKCVGGIVSVANKVINCHNINTTIKQTASDFTGGIAAQINKEILNCTNSGTITSTSQYLGGIVGAINDNTIISNCTNFGTIVGETQNSNRVGGIAGYVGIDAQIKECINNGSVTSPGYQIAGIVGFAYTGKINDSINNATITLKYSNMLGMQGAGIAGAMNTNSEVKNCTNIGNINGEKYISGIVSYIYDVESIVSNCVNKGNITANANYAGGIAGYSKSIVKNCTNMGNVTSTGDRIGGILGENVGGVTNCVNSGTVIGASCTGGIVGITFNSITKCGNTANVTLKGIAGEDNCVGGITGEIGINCTVTIENCYNTGNIIVETANSDSIAGIVGWVSETGTSGAINNTYNAGLIELKAENVTGIGGTIGLIKTQAIPHTNNHCIEGITKVEGFYGYAYTGMIKTAEYMKSEAFVADLNSVLETPVWEIRAGENKGYPVIIKEQ